MRSSLLCLILLICLSSLGGCLYYGDLDKQSQLLSASALQKPNAYPIPTSFKADGWWKKFNDPQLNQLISIALTDSPTMQIATSRVREADAIAKGAVSPLWPSLNFAGYVTRERFSTFGLAPPPFNGKTFNIGDLALNVNYEVDFFGKNRATLAAKVSEACARESDLAESRLILSASIAQSYFELQSTIEKRRLATFYWQQNQKIAGIVKDRAKKGIESDIPVKTTLAQAEIARLSIDRYQEAEALLRNRLAVLIGKNPILTQITVTPFSTHRHSVKLPESLTANILAQRPDIYAAKARVQAAAHRIHVAKTAFFPNVNLNAFFSYQAVDLQFLFNPLSQNNAGTVAVDLPLFDAGARRANLGAKYAEYDASVNQYNSTILNALNDAGDQLAKLKSIKAQQRSQSMALRETKYHYKLVRSRYNHGVVDYTAVLAISQELTQQQAQTVDLQAKHLQTIVAMIKALGGYG